MKNYCINSVHEYLKIIKENNLQNYIFRGQNEPYNGICATAFRPYSGDLTNDKLYDISKIKKIYFNKVITKISNDERKYFSAFCQHHGLPTNLVDFSCSPLIALFFACYGKSRPCFTVEKLLNKEKVELNELQNKEIQSILIQNLIDEVKKDNYSEYAEVYLINKDRLIDISDIMITLEETNKTFTESLIEDNNTQKNLAKMIETKFINNEKLMKESLIKIINCYIINELHVYDFDNALSNKYIDNELMKYSNALLYDFNVKTLTELYFYVIDEIYDENISYGPLNINDYISEYNDIPKASSSIFLMLLINLIEILQEYVKPIIFDIGLYFTYQPPKLFERITNQNGLFIYQFYTSHIDDILNHRLLNYQKIYPDITIKINNFKEILEDLDLLDINLGKVYMDLDNIAKSITTDPKNFM